MSLKRSFQKFKNIYHFLKALISNVFFAFPSRKLIVIGVTGTNGKTTTVQMIAKVLEATEKKVAVYSTINFKIGNKEDVNKTKFTTESAWNLQKFIKKTVRENCHYLVLETSSHALDQFRVWGVDYNVAVITNITREHLDYHFTMKDYRKTKLKLFRITSRAWKSTAKKIAIINGDMKKFEEFILPKMNENYLYGIDIKKKVFKNQPVWKADNLKFENFKSQFEVDGVNFKLDLPGKFNVENALAAICVGVSQKIPMNKIKKQLQEISSVPGRMEKIENDKNINVFIDYALTPDSMEKLGELMISLKKKNKTKLIWVFGSCGDRDRGKRPIMGKIVEKFADLMIITNEDPYTEDPVQILDEIENGVKNKKKLLRIEDRKKAIKEAISRANKNDIVLITGKGAEENMMIGNKKIPWSDKKVVQDYLNKIEKK
jgi:UDP-N-acetylmuramoyl-L-alanyl-D-glutamate--2,6-diaminopimelate ligase